jgi:hypothetical protein
MTSVWPVTESGGHHPGNPRDVHDATLVLPLEVRGRGPRHEEGAAEVRVDGSIPDLGRQRIEIAKRYRVVPGGIVDKDVEATERIRGGLHG